MDKYKGKIIVNGIGIGNVNKIKPLTIEVKNIKLTKLEITKELVRASQIYKTAIKDLKLEIEENKDAFDEETLDIIKGHVLLIEDEEITDRIVEVISENETDFVSACNITRFEYVELFKDIKDSYIKERIADIEDICNRFIKLYNNETTVELKGIIVTEEITPSDILNFMPNQVKGIVTEKGTMNCHAAILARTLNIPFITGIKKIYENTQNGDLVIINTFNNEVIVNPNKTSQNKFQKDYKKYLEEIKELELFIDKQPRFKDGKSFEIGVNIGNVLDVSIAKKVKATSVGLFRSEYLYMDITEFPSEDYLYNKYVEMTEPIDGEIIVRTLDVGGDKLIKYFNIPKEDNPYLGYRAIRYCLEHKEVLKTQFKAILRLSSIKKIKIMIPMITSVNEVLETKKILEESKKELTSKNIDFDKDIEFGIMIETPASVIISDLLGEIVDFFSIGTNDLLQYTMAADRNNSLVEENYSPYSHAFIRMISITVNNAVKAKIPISICGEIASDTKFLPILIGLGIRKISVTPSALLRVKKLVSSVTIDECNAIANNLTKIIDEKELKKYIALR